MELWIKELKTPILIINLIEATNEYETEKTFIHSTKVKAFFI